MFDAFIDNYEHILHNVAEVSALTLEFIGVIIIVIGSIKALFHLGDGLIKHRAINIVVELGKTLALALEFKMGAEIIKTVIVHDLKELAVLGIVILIRALLAFLIHWEMKMEKKDEEDKTEETE
ncbi:MAG: DUF1622 domain-containing protein [Ruminococcaceae bacterium]|nr:DUF1622 domain-containing protein [Oscillospiraceae bacterium]